MMVVGCGLINSLEITKRILALNAWTKHSDRKQDGALFKLPATKKSQAPCG